MVSQLSGELVNISFKFFNSFFSCFIISKQVFYLIVFFLHYFH